MTIRLKTFVPALLLLGITVVSATGCDFFRILAGRPTSSDIRLKREAMERAAADSQRQARADSTLLEHSQKSGPDTIGHPKEVKTVQSQSLPIQAPVRRAGKSIGKTTASIGCRYCIVVGSFSNEDNAKKLMSKASAAGYKAISFKSASGLTTVGIGPSDSSSEINETLARLLKEDFCPKDAWILDNE